MMKYQKWFFGFLFFLILPITVESGNFLKKATRVITNPLGSVSRLVGGNIVSSALGPSLKDFGTTINDVTYTFNNNMSDRLKEFDAIAAKNLEKVDANIATRLIQIDDIAKSNIALIDQGLDNKIDRLENILNQRTKDIGDIVDGANRDLSKNISKNIALLDMSIANNLGAFEEITSTSLITTNQILEDRINQMDESIYKNVGVLNSSGTKISHVFSLSLINVVFISILLIILTIAYLYKAKILQVDFNFSEFLGNKEFRKLYSDFLLKEVLVSSIPLILVLFMVKFVSVNTFGPKREIRKMIEEYERGFSSSLKTLDDRDMYYYGTQLEFLDPDLRHYKIKANAIREVFTTLSIPDQRSTMFSKKEAIEQAAELNPEDPDIDALQSFFVWQYKETKFDEYEAACHAVAAFKKAKGEDFPLASIAFNYLRNYCARPMPDDLIQIYSKGIDEQQNIYTNQEMVDWLDSLKHKEISVSAKFEHLFYYDDLVSQLVTNVDSYYLDLVETLYKINNENTASEKAELIAQRKSLARKIIDEYDNFEYELFGSSRFQASFVPLSAFRINDAIYTRAKAYEKTDTDEVIGSYQDYNDLFDDPNELLPLRARVAPRYLSYFSHATRSIQEYIETKRFIQYDSLLFKFENSYVETLKRDDGFNDIADSQVNNFNQLMETVKLAYSLNFYTQEETNKQDIKTVPLFINIYKKHRGFTEGNWGTSTNSRFQKNREDFKNLILNILYQEKDSVFA